jgi:hypothetical protein
MFAWKWIYLLLPDALVLSEESYADEWISHTLIPGF